ncbi:substrate-binding periplasmic protein [Pseudomaricurvus alkylphenolicus]|uniref:substrate-binding periplasmic protein n=1 Tax=Pseudomaricurvus alkylphenolicus TaxID=1306991 RepID=UPI0014228557|nr:ABC transporter substrate-binding protein [Pseudomaricurvus alkylphenolicus]
MAESCIEEIFVERARCASKPTTAWPVQWCLVLAIILSFAQLTAASPEQRCTRLKISAASWPPVFQPATDNRPASGVGWKLLQQIQRSLAVDVELLRAEPFARELHLLRSGQRDALISLYPIGSRRSAFDYTLPYFTEPLYVYTREHDQLRIATLSDLDGLTGSRIRGSSLGQRLDDYFARHQSLIPINHNRQYVTLLLAGRTDFFINSPTTSMELIAEQQATHLIRRSRNAIAWAEVAMAFSLRSPCRRLIPDINRLISRHFQPLESSSVVQISWMPIGIGIQEKSTASVE